MKVEEILANAPKGISKVTLMRYIYLELGKTYKRNTNFFYGTDEEKEKIYNGKKVDEDTSIICKSIGEIYVKVFQQAGIQASCVNKETKSPFPHIDIIASPDGGEHCYYMNPMDDLYRIQGRLKTKRFGNKTSKYKGLDSFSEEELRKMDGQLGYTFKGLYMDEFFDMVREEFMNRTKMKEYILEQNPQLTNRDLTKDMILECKLDFIMKYITEFEKMQGYIELKKYQKEVFGKLLNQTERRKIKIHNLCNPKEDKNDMRSVIDVRLEDKHIYYVTRKGTNEFIKMTAEEMLEYMEDFEWHFLKEKGNLDRPEERE